MLWIPTFILIGFINLVCVVLGLIVVPIATLTKSYTQSTSLWGEPILVWSSPLMLPWQNFEDGIVAGSEYPNKPLWFRIIYWSAIRNPANGLRFISLLAPIPETSKVKFIASFGSHKSGYSHTELSHLEDHGNFWYFCWYKNYANFRIQYKRFRFWIGTKVYPSTIHKLPNYQAHGVGTTCQIKLLKDNDL